MSRAEVFWYRTRNLAANAQLVDKIIDHLRATGQPRPLTPEEADRES